MTWDIYSKLLLKECPQDFVSYCVPGARFVRMRESQFQTSARSRYQAREIRGDGVIEAEFSGCPFLVHVEWQSSKDDKMDVRVLGYGYEALRLHELPSCSLVIYLQEVNDVPRGPKNSCIPTGRCTIWFDFDNLELSKQSVKTFRQLNLDAFYTLMLLCEDGARYEVLDEVLERLVKHDRKELIAITRFFAGKVFKKKSDYEQLERRFGMLRDFLQDSWTFQQTLQEGRKQGEEQGRKRGLKQGLKQGHKEGLKEGVKEGVLIGQKQSIEKIASTRFPNMLALLKQKLDALSSQEQLDHLLNAVSLAQTEDEVEQFLATLV